MCAVYKKESRNDREASGARHPKKRRWKPTDFEKITVAYRPTYNRLINVSGNRNRYEQLDEVKNDLGLMGSGVHHQTSQLLSRIAFSGNFCPEVRKIKTVILFSLARSNPMPFSAGKQRQGNCLSELLSAIPSKSSL
jgi:hypothetical protein